MLSSLWDVIVTGVCSVLFFVSKWLLRFVELVEMFFNVFAGTEKILYKNLIILCEKRKLLRGKRL